MSFTSNFRVLVDGDSSKVYRQGDQVKGRVELVLEKEEQVNDLRVQFVGAINTKTSRPVYVSVNGTESRSSRREYEEEVRLFNFEQKLASNTVLTASKHSWNFDYTFPENTEPSYSKWAHGSDYLKDPHPLPPSFTIHSNVPSGKATVCYYVQATLTRRGSSDTRRTTQYLGYQPPSPPGATLEPKITPKVLYAQSWKPTEGTRTAKDKILTRVSRRSNSKSKPRIVPTLHFPEKVSPGQHIPLLLSLSNANSSDGPECAVDSLSISISTHTTMMCGSSCTQPEDVLSKHVTCISKQNMNLPVSYNTPTKLTTNFRLVDDAECVPTFKTYTITRRYAMTIMVGVKVPETNQKFVIRSTHPLDIVPKLSSQELRARGLVIDEDDTEDDPLPLYRPREYSMEMAPDYETLYSLRPASSTSDTVDSISSTSGSEWSGASTPITMPSTPETEIEQPIFGDPFAYK